MHETRQKWIVATLSYKIKFSSLCMQNTWQWHTGFCWQHDENGLRCYLQHLRREKERKQDFLVNKWILSLKKKSTNECILNTKFLCDLVLWCHYRNITKKLLVFFYSKINYQNLPFNKRTFSPTWEMMLFQEAGNTKTHMKLFYRSSHE